MMGVLVFFSNLIVLLGVHISYSSITFIGRACFGMFSAGLLCKIKNLAID